MKPAQQDFPFPEVKSEQKKLMEVLRNLVVIMWITRWDSVAGFCVINF